MKQRSWMLGLVALALLVSGRLPAHAVTLEVTVDGQKRRALVDPGRDAATRPSPLLLVFHPDGDGTTAAPAMAELSRFSQAWPEATVVYPMAVNRWILDAEINDRDVRFVEALIEELKARYQVDERRIYAAGGSRGAVFAQQLLIFCPEPFAAFAALGASHPSLRWATTPRPMMLLIGTNDRDGYALAERGRNQALRLGSCGGEGTEWAPGATLYADCVGGPPVLFFTYRGGHEWHWNATASIVRFFKEQALPEAPAPRTPLGEPPALEAILGTGKPIFGTTGRPAAESGTAAPVAIACDAAGGYAFLEDTGYRARKIEANGQLAPPIRAEDFFWAEGLAVDREGNLYVADTSNHLVLRFDAAGKRTRIAGTARPGRAIGFSGDGGPAARAELSFPQGLAVDRDGNLYIADSENHRVRKVDRDGIITTVAGSGTAGFAGDGERALAARLNAPSGLAIDREGNLYVADTGNRRVRRIAPDGTITTVAGTGVPGTAGDGGRAEAAALTSPNALAVDREGNLFIADNHAYRVRKVAADGVITTVLAAPAGQGRYLPDGLAIDRAGNLLVADPFNHRIWKVTGVAAPGLVAGEPFPEP